MEVVSKFHAAMTFFDRLFILNPDLPLRFSIDSKLKDYDRYTFYTHHQVTGYTDYPFDINSPIANIFLNVVLSENSPCYVEPTDTEPLMELIN